MVDRQPAVLLGDRAGLADLGLRRLAQRCWKSGRRSRWPGSPLPCRSCGVQLSRAHAGQDVIAADFHGLPDRFPQGLETGHGAYLSRPFRTGRQLGNRYRTRDQTRASRDLCQRCQACGDARARIPWIVDPLSSSPGASRASRICSTRAGHRSGHSLSQARPLQANQLSEANPLFAPVLTLPHHPPTDREGAAGGAGTENRGRGVQVHLVHRHRQRHPARGDSRRIC